MTDDKFDEFLERAARTYHEPTPTPREAMWTRIEAARRVRRLAPAATRRRRWLGAAALAATLLFGIALGTWIGRSAPAGGGAPATVAQAPSAPRNPAAVMFDAAAADHLGRAEALLTTFNTESARGTLDPQIGAWAGDLLTTTRLLLDSPRARNPRTRKLLSDLEVVLAQIAQLKQHPDSQSDELELIEQAVQSHDMMTRLRDATPPGNVAVTTGS